MRSSPGSGWNLSADVARTVLDRARVVAVAARSALRRIARKSRQLTNAPSGLMTRQHQENLRSATGESARVACSNTNHCSSGRRVGATRMLMKSFSWLGSAKASKASRLVNRRGAWLTRCSCAADPVISSWASHRAESACLRRRAATGTSAWARPPACGRPVGTVDTGSLPAPTSFHVAERDVMKGLEDSLR